MSGHQRGVPPGVHVRGTDPPLPVQAGVPAHAEDDVSWDGRAVYHRVGERVRGSEAEVLRAADVMVENRTDCCPGSAVCGSLRVLSVEQGRVVEAGFVRLTEAGGHL